MSRWVEGMSSADWQRTADRFARDTWTPVARVDFVKASNDALHFMVRLHSHTGPVHWVSVDRNDPMRSMNGADYRTIVHFPPVERGIAS
jgi:hypothetical protein